MYLGIDVGGTHTDGVALEVTGRSARVVAACKVKTRTDLLQSIVSALRTLLQTVDAASVRQLNLSTTLSTNAIVQARTEEVGMLVSAGPGIDPTTFQPCRHFHVVPGALDHRGREVDRLDTRAAKDAIRACRADNVRVYAIVGKFSTRNPLHENTLRHLLCSTDADATCEGADFVTLGHTLSGRLGFPRRLATAYFNAAVWRVFGGFATAVESALAELGLGHIRVNILKADGGTMPVSLARRVPVQSIFSGPAASVMGIVALCDIFHDSIILDIGGTTTDIAVFASGAPLIEPDGIPIGSHPTLVRALKVHSIGIGGDSAIGLVQGVVRVGPNRLGPSACLGGDHPTLCDALNVAGHCAVGDVAASARALAAFAAAHALAPDDLADLAVTAAAQAIHVATRELLDEINSRPVYTIHELLENARIVPKKIYLMGGPAEAMKMPIFGQFRLSCEVPPNFAVANAIGAALTRTTTGIELFADTDKHVMLIPSLGHRENIPASYSLDDAIRDANNHLLAHLIDLRLARDAQRAEITHASSFNMVRGEHTVGRNIRVKCQIKPGVLATLHEGGRGRNA
ncbi:MAG: hydantoinase/oxoprolinase family protein [Desulfovibrionaceae bacterium]